MVQRIDVLRTNDLVPFFYLNFTIVKKEGFCGVGQIVIG